MPDNIIADIRRAMPIHAAERDVLAAAKALDTAAQDPAADLSALMDALFEVVGRLREVENQ